jgi:hypothetical protein
MQDSQTAEYFASNAGAVMEEHLEHFERLIMRSSFQAMDASPQKSRKFAGLSGLINNPLSASCPHRHLLTPFRSSILSFVYERAEYRVRIDNGVVVGGDVGEW